MAICTVYSDNESRCRDGELFLFSADAIVYEPETLVEAFRALRQWRPIPFYRVILSSFIVDVVSGVWSSFKSKPEQNNNCGV